MDEQQPRESSSPVIPGPVVKDRLVFLDGVRALAALYVVVHHIWLTTYPDYPRNTGPGYLGWLLYGHLAVTVFIVVSGYSLALAPARRHLELGGYRRFLKRRAWRIIPPYWAALALSALVFGLLAPSVTGHLVTVKSVLVHALLIQDVVNSPKPNGAFWSIAIEWQIYFLFPLVLLCFRRLGRYAAVLLAVASAVAANALGESVPALHGLLNLTPQFFALFVVGAAAATIRSSGRLSTWMAAGFALVFAAFVLMAASLGSVWIDRQYFWIDLMVGAGVALMIAALANGRLGPVRKVLGSRLLVWVGAFSYSVYLVHLPLLWVTNYFLVSRIDQDPLANFVLLCLVGLPVVIVGSYLFYRVMERPFVENRSFGAIMRRPGPRAESRSHDAEPDISVRAG